MSVCLSVYLCVCVSVRLYVFMCVFVSVSVCACKASKATVKHFGVPLSLVVRGLRIL